MTTERKPPAVPGDLERRALDLVTQLPSLRSREALGSYILEALRAVRDAERERAEAKLLNLQQRLQAAESFTDGVVKRASDALAREAPSPLVTASGEMYVPHSLYMETRTMLLTAHAVLSAIRKGPSDGE